MEREHKSNLTSQFKYSRIPGQSNEQLDHVRKQSNIFVNEYLRGSPEERSALLDGLDEYFKQATERFNGGEMTTNDALMSFALHGLLIYQILETLSLFVPYPRKRSNR